MNLPLPPEVEAAFAAALEFPASEQSAFLNRQYPHDPNLRRDVEALLRVFHAAGSFLDPVAVFPLPGGCASSVPAAIGPYQIHRLLGEGAMGAVYEATQEHPRRSVALKVIKPGLAGPELFRRFELESLALARLQHPGIAQIYDAGAADTGFGLQPYFAMEFIHGESLTAYANAHQLTTRQRLEIVAKVCEAVHHAHQRGIIHRDLKAREHPRRSRRPAQNPRFRCGPRHWRRRLHYAPDRPGPPARHSRLHESRAGTRRPARSRYPK